LIALSAERFWSILMALPADMPILLSACKRVFSNRSALLLFGLLFTISNAWAMQYMCAKMIGETRVPPFVALLIVHYVIVVGFTFALGLQGKLFKLTLARAVFFVYAAGLGNVASLGVELAAAPHISAGLLTLIVAMAPLFTLLYSVLLGTETIGLRRLSALALGACATLLILWPELSFRTENANWAIMAFAAPACFGAMSVIIWAAWPKGLNALQVAYGNAVAALFFLVPLAIVEVDALGFTADYAAAGLPLAGFTVSLIVEYWLFAVITQRGGAIYASCADFGAIALGLVWAFFLFQEVPTGWMVVAAIAATGSMLVMKKANEA
jgi:drug/metabolite transporter (DMT)-like permease